MKAHQLKSVPSRAPASRPKAIESFGERILERAVAQLWRHLLGHLSAEVFERRLFLGTLQELVQGQVGLVDRHASCASAQLHGIL